jgi:hypothetical protein
LTFQDSFAPFLAYVEDDKMSGHGMDLLRSSAVAYIWVFFQVFAALGAIYGVLYFSARVIVWRVHRRFVSSVMEIEAKVSINAMNDPDLTVDKMFGSSTESGLVIVPELIKLDDVTDEAQHLDFAVHAEIFKRGLAALVASRRHKGLSALFSLQDLQDWFHERGQVVPGWVWDQLTLSEMTLEGWEKATRVSQRRRVRRPEFAGLMAKLLKLKYGQLVESVGDVRKANVLMVHREAGKLMESLNVRLHDQAEIIHKVVALCFIPSRSETEARQLMKSAAAFSATRAFDATYLSWLDVVSWCEWFLGEPPRRA